MKLDELKNTLVSEKLSIIACRDDNEFYRSSLDGIKPVLFKVKEDVLFFKDAIVVDRIIGKASAMLLCRSGVRYVHAGVISKAGEEILKKHNVDYSYDSLCEYIVNRTGDDMCPMEKTVRDIDDLEEAYTALDNKVKELSGANH